jgi:hypothetical protein
LMQTMFLYHRRGQPAAREAFLCGPRHKFHNMPKNCMILTNCN